jgi:hypothetical protein
MASKSIEQLTREVLKELLAEQLKAKPQAKRKYVKSGKYAKVIKPAAITKRPVGRPRKVVSNG